VFPVKRFELGVANPGGDILMHLTADAAGRLIRLTVPAQALDIVREDVAAANARISTFANPGDESVTIPASGFNIAGTLTRHAGGGDGRMPAVVLLPGQNATDRDSVIAGVPFLAQIAGALADAGIVSLRFDRRGFGQSGGRAESATLSDFAEDAKTVVKYLADRPFVDSRRIGILGHAEGAWVALLTTAREGKVKAAVLIAAPASTGADFVLEQQQVQLDQLKIAGADRQAKVDLQKQINEAVLTGKGWEQIPREYRRADTPWLQSFLRFDPARALKDVDEPLLILTGTLDREVPAANADRLAALARQVSDSKSVEVVTVEGVNHLLVPAAKGDVGEYGSLADRTVSKEATSAISGWLSRTLADRRR
jgi:pimeloyl-ACP methyl ester carboxylesterase